MEMIGRRLRGVISEKHKGFSSWIRFGESSLSLLLDGVESCCRQEVKGKCVKRWEENGRKLCLESRANGAGRYLLCLVLDLEAKRFCIVISEG